MSTHSQNPYDKTELAVRNVRAFHDDNLILGIPQGFFMGGIVVMVMSYLLFGFFWLPPVMGVAYYAPMYAMHKDDPKGFTIWMAALSSRTLAWESGTRTPFPIIVLS
jgi:type IV secretory pathway VirB3-like protein